MPKKLAHDLSDRLEAEVRRHLDGVGAGLLCRAFASDASPRTVARLLARLAAANKLLVQGKGRATLYLPPANRRSALERALLDDYRPNQTWYLEADRRARLREIGRQRIAQRASGTHPRSVLDRLVLDLSWASSQLEGGTYSRLDAAHLFEHGRAPESADLRETQMLLNHRQAIEFLIEQAAEVGCNMYTLMNLHALLAENLVADPAAGGRLHERTAETGIPTEDSPAVRNRTEARFRALLDKADAIRDPFEQSFFLMVHVAHLRPFEDLSEPVSRLAANIPLLRNDLRPLSFVDVPSRAYRDGMLALREHARIDLLGDVFAGAYERSCRRLQTATGGVPEPDPFRLQYRTELAATVAELVRSGAAVEPRAVRPLAASRIAQEDLPRFVKMVLTELRHLHEGNIARYRLHPAEFRAWQDATRVA